MNPLFCMRTLPGYMNEGLMVHWANHRLSLVLHFWMMSDTRWVDRTTDGGRDCGSDWVISTDTFYFKHQIVFILKLRCKTESKIEQSGALGYKIVDSFREYIIFLFVSSKAPMSPNPLKLKRILRQARWNVNSKPGGSYQFIFFNFSLFTSFI